MGISVDKPIIRMTKALRLPRCLIGDIKEHPKLQFAEGETKTIRTGTIIAEEPNIFETKNTVYVVLSWLPDQGATPPENVIHEQEA